MRHHITIILLILSINIFAQQIDQIEAVIGNEIILKSDIEMQYLQYLSQGEINASDLRCNVIEELLTQKLLIHQAKLDSIQVSNDEIDKEVKSRITYFERQLGSIEKVEEYFDKSYAILEKELRKVIKEQFYTQRMENKITGDVKVTPYEVKSYFLEIDEIDIPTIPTQVEILQIVIKPEISKEQRDKIKDKLRVFKERVNNGEDFNMLATLYSDDTESAKKGGELGFVNRGELVPEFERAAFRLKENEISEIIETKYGFHIIQLIERRGEEINVRHILIQPKPDATSNNNAKEKTEEIIREIESGIMTYEEAVQKYSDDESKNNAGILINPNTMSSMHLLEEMSPELRLQIINLKQGDISKQPILAKIPGEGSIFRIIKLNKRIEEHKANMEDDFTTIKNYSLNIKKQKILSQWINSTIKITFINFDNKISACSFKNNWIK